VLRLGRFAFGVTLFAASAALAAEPMTPSEIQANFFTGQPFTATSPSGTKFKMTFTPGGKMIREPLEQSGNTSIGTWKLNAKGFCTTWSHSKPNCFTVVPSGENKWSVQKIATTIATTVAIWSK
jgi:hypothetical protein